jgi:hypothetical protein
MNLLAAIPLLVIISFVYAATRYERWPDIWRHALRVFVSFSSLLAVVFLILVALCLWVV